MMNAYYMIGTGVINADPTAHIAAAWVISALLLGGLTIHAVIKYRRALKGPMKD